MKKKTLRVIAFVCGLLLITGAIIFYRVYNKPHRSVATETALVVTATALVAEYEKEEAAADKNYLGKAVQVSGNVSEVSVNQQKKTVIVLSGSGMSAVQCSLLEEVTDVKKGDAVAIKGFCTGFLTDVILDRCILVR